MNLSERHIRIINADLCPYCGSSTKKVKEEDVYRGVSYSDKDVIVCERYPKCDSYVGCHKDGRPLGRLANNKLRHLKKYAHEEFDKLWKDKHLTRKKAYLKLSDELGIDPEYTHIGMFGEQTCMKVREWAIETLESYPKQESK